MSNKGILDIRHLASDDTCLMRSLLNLFGDAFEDIEIYCSAQPSGEYLRSLLAKDYFIVLVALKDEEVVGGLTAYELHKFEQQRSEIYIYDLAVSSEHRRRGIATALIEALKDIASERGAYVVIVQADDGDEPAINLYSKLGTKERVLHFDIVVSKNVKRYGHDYLG